MIKGVTSLDAGVYREAKKADMTFEQYLAKLAMNGEVDGDFINPDLLPESGASNPRDALQQAMQKQGITMASKGEVFFTEPANKVLFPAFLDRVWRDYTFTSDVEVTLADLIIATEPITGNQIEGLTVSNPTGLTRSRIGQGAELPRYKITVGGYTNTAYKYGGMVEMSYEAQRRSTLNMIAIALREVAKQEQRDKVIDLLAILLNGDGNSNPAWNLALAGSTYDWIDMVTIRIKASQRGQQFSNFVGDEVEILEASKLVLPVANKPSNALQERLVTTGEIVGPAGYGYKVTPPGSVFDASKKLMGIPAGGAAIYYQESGSVIQESDKIISHQVDQFTFSEVSGFGKPNPNLTGTLTRP